MSTVDTNTLIKGRGASWNPQNRFERIEYVHDEDAHDDDEPSPLPRTIFLRDPTRTILATNNTPDVGLDTSINPYRGRGHGWLYCSARPSPPELGVTPG